MAEARVRGFSIATKCATVDELIEKFRDRIDEESILVNTVESRDVGTECAFAILLADKKVALAGTCVVRDVYTDANNPFKRPGMRLHIKRLGPESQKVFAQLVAKRIAPRKMTQALPVIAVPRTSTDTMKPVVVMPRHARAKTEAPRAKAAPDIVVPRTATQPIHRLRADSPALEVAREQPRRMPTLQIPPLEAPIEELARAPRATPFELETLQQLEAKELEEKQTREAETKVEAKVEAETKVEAAKVEAETKVEAAKVEAKTKVEAKVEEAKVEAETKVEAKAPARVEERVPGSPYILPANPLTNISDASLEGFVDCRLFEAKGALATPPTFPAGTQDEAHDDAHDEARDVAHDVAPAEPPPPIVRDMHQPATRAVTAGGEGPTDPFARPFVEHDPLPLPPPPTPRAEIAESAPATPLSYAETKLPDLHSPRANDSIAENARPPLITRRTGLRLALAIVLLPLIGAGAVIAYVELAASPSPTIATLAPEAHATPEVSTSLHASVEPAPPAPVEPLEPVEVVAPTTPQPIHAVFVQTYPIAARVTVGTRSFGTTPTYIKIPANTPVKIRMERMGFKPVVQTFVSKRRTDRVFVRLQRRGAR